MDTSNWRDQLLPETRPLMLNNIMDQLKLGYRPGDYDGFLELQKVAQSVEQKSYAGATSQSDYFKKIALKMLLLKEARKREWENKQEEVYQKIKTMKENYLPELNEMYQKIATELRQHESLPQQPKSDQLERLKVFKMMLECIITFLQVSKSNILPSYVETLGSYEKQIDNFRRMHSMSQPQSQVTQVQSHENQMNSQLQTTNTQEAGEREWRALLHLDSRQIIVNKIADMLRRHLPVSGPEGSQEIWKIAQRFEEKIFDVATSQSDYLRKISLKMLTTETNPQRCLGQPSHQLGSDNESASPVDTNLRMQSSRSRRRPTWTRDYHMG